MAGSFLPTTNIGSDTFGISRKCRTWYIIMSYTAQLQDLKVYSPDPTTVSFQLKSSKTGQTTTYGGPYSAKTFETFKQTSQSRLKNYFQLKAEGKLLPHTGFTQVEYINQLVKSNYSLTDSGDWKREHIGGSSSNPFAAYDFDQYSADTSIPTDLQIFVQEAASRIATKGHDSLTFLAELHKTRTMMDRILRRIIALVKEAIKLLKKLKRQPKYASMRLADLISNLWLEGRYGWRTLVYDLDSLQQAISEFDEIRMRYSERAGDTYRNTANFSSGELSGSYFYYQYNVQDEYEVSRRGSVSADIRPPQFQFNPVITAWELVPWSFVIDWILDVGKALGATSFYALAGDHSSSGGYQITIDRTATLDVNSPKTGVTIHNVSYENQSWIRKNARIPMSVSTIPQYGVNLDVWKGLDLLALFWQVVRPTRK
jgi:hypothetical protein